jgi:hypothetical protein
MREIVERENSADLSTTGWYYPRTRSSAAVLDGLYHEIIRVGTAVWGLAPGAAEHPQPARAVTRMVIRAALQESRRSARIVRVLELSAGLIAEVVGTNVMRICTSHIAFDG